MSEVEADDTLPSNLMVMLTLVENYGEPVVLIGHREEDNYDTAVFSLHGSRILAGALTTPEEEEEMALWVLDNSDCLLYAWNNEQLKIITSDGTD